MTAPIRRVVTGHDAEGRSTILMDGPSPNVALLEKAGGLQLTELWATSESPANNAGTADAALRARKIEPDGVGSVFRVIEYPPDRVRLKSLQPQAHFASMGAQAADEATRRHPGMHRTDTVDYAIILSGEIYAVLDTGETLLRAGDVLVQRGTQHAWSNRSDQSCSVAFVLLSARALA